MTEVERTPPTPRPRPELTRWKRVLIGVAAAFVVIGGGLRAFAGSNDAPAQPPTADPAEVPAPQDGPPGAPSSLVGDQDPAIEWPPKGPGDGSPPIDWPPGGGTGSEDGPSTAQPGAAGWSPFFLKGGFSFFVAFCVGYALRVWLKLAALFLGTFFVGVFLLSYLGVVDVDWLTIEGWWDALVARVEGEAVDFKTFLTGSLPQAGIAGLGLVAGFRKR